MPYRVRSAFAAIGNSSSRTRIAGAALAGLLGACAVGAPPAAAQPNVAPNLYIDGNTGWLPVGDDFLPPPSGPGPITFDKRHPYVDNGTARRTHTQPSASN